MVKLTGGRGADLVVEVGGSGTFDKSVAAVRFGGTVALIGVLTGLGGTVNTAAILRRHVRVQGIYVGIARDVRRDEPRNHSPPVAARHRTQLCVRPGACRVRLPRQRGAHGQGRDPTLSATEQG